MISWSPTTVHPLASGKFIAVTELIVDGEILRTGKGVANAPTYLIGKHGADHGDAIAKVEREKPYVIANAKRDGKI